MLAASCPRCGAETAPATPRCRRCGFVFFEAREPRVRTPLSPRRVGATAAAVVVLAAAALLLTRDGPPPPPEPVTPARAEQRLQSQLALDAYPGGAQVRCNGEIRPGASTRCHVLYAVGETQLVLVSLDSGGELDVNVPYPAQRRPAADSPR
jgi:hypothetical protein